MSLQTAKPKSMQTQPVKKSETPVVPSASFDVKAYFKGMHQEWGRITWPTREQLIAATGIVVVVVTVFSLFVFVVDKILQWVIQAIT